MIVTIICIALLIYFWVLVAVIVLSFITMMTSIPYSPVLRRVIDVLHALTNPVLQPLRRVLPPVGAGAVAFDLSPIIVFVVIWVLRASLGC
ncbi:MAG TPA: YggT family protein [Actinomycetota bacterium]